MSEIVLEGVSKHYGAVRAVDRIGFRAAAGKFLALLGPSNSWGGSSAFRTMCETQHRGRRSVPAPKPGPRSG
jgi:ABC-type sugar transport system ATPase subunit